MIKQLALAEHKREYMYGWHLVFTQFFFTEYGHNWFRHCWWIWDKNIGDLGKNYLATALLALFPKIEKFDLQEGDARNIWASYKGGHVIIFNIEKSMGNDVNYRTIEQV